MFIGSVLRIRGVPVQCVPVSGLHGNVTRYQSDPPGVRSPLRTTEAPALSTPMFSDRAAVAPPPVSATSHPSALTPFRLNQPDWHDASTTVPAWHTAIACGSCATTPT